jgi:HAE1 family hydrophobic/amphiphilic exporter-1
MSLTEVSVNRPVTTAMFFIGIAIIGVIAVSYISVDYLPSVQIPELLVQTVYVGASPEEVERQISEPIESMLNTVKGVKRVISISREGLSLVRLQFYWGTDIDYAMLEVREKLDAIRGSLPEDAQRPTIVKIDPSSESIMTIALTYSYGVMQKGDMASLKEFAQALVKRRLEQIEGVSQAVVAGGYDREVHVLVDVSKMRSFNLTLEDISNALKSSNLSLVGGTIKQGVFRYPFRVASEFRDLKDIENVIIKTGWDKGVRLSDIAEVRFDFVERQGLTRLNGSEAILIFVKKESGANSINVSKKVRGVVDELVRDYPDVKIEIVFDQAEFIRKSISDIEQAIFWGALFAFLSLFIFLRDFRYPLVIGIATPFSILATVVMMYLAGINFNIISLTGLALGIGMIGDNAVIIVENFTRLREKGLSVREAVLEGAKEINLAVSAATFTNVAIFLPVVLVKGVAQKLFLDMGLTMTFSLLSSLLVAVMLVPGILSRLKERDIKQTAKTTFFKRFYDGFMNSYINFLKWSLKNRGVVIFATILLTLISLGVAFLIRAEQAPDIDQSRFTIEVNMPYGSTLEAVSSAVEMIEKQLLNMKEVSAVVSDIGISSQEDYFSILFASLNKAKIYVKVKPEFSVDDVMKRVRQDMIESGLFKKFEAIGAEVVFQRRTTTFERILQSAESDIAIKIVSKQVGVTSLDSAILVARKVAEKIKKIGGVSDIRIIPEPGNPQIKILVDKDEIAKYGFNNSRILSEIEGYLKGKIATHFNTFSDRIPIRVIANKSDDEDVLISLLNYSLKMDRGNYVASIPVRSIVKVGRERGLSEIYRENGNRAVVVLASASGKNILSLSGEIGEILNDVEKSHPSFSVKLGGKIEEIYESYRGLLIIILLSIFLVYMILASEYESIVYPLVILITSPLALVGAFIMMYLAGQSYNVMSIVGLVIMLGAIDNDAVIAVDLIISNRRNGMKLEEAILDGMTKRFRPIVMTTLTTILGIIPLVLGFGKGLELAVAISYPVIGGLIASTLFTLFVIPVVYSYFDKFSLKGR